jgi:putative transcriptional regulator
MNQRTLKNKIKVHRALKNWTQEELAYRVGVTRKTINTIETRKFMPSAYLAIRIAQEFNVPVEELFEIDGD